MTRPALEPTFFGCARRWRCVLWITLGITLAGMASGDTGPAVEADSVTLERIMADPDWIGNAPESPYWSADSSTIYFERKRHGEPLRDLWRLPRDGGEAERVADADLGAVDAEGGELSPDRRRKVYSHHGDIFVKDLAAGKVMQLTRTTAREHSPYFLADSTRVAFARGDDVVVRDLLSGLELEPAELRTEDDPGKAAPADDYLSRSELRLFEIVRRWQEDAAIDRDRERALRRADPSRVPPTLYLGDKVEIDSRHLSPAGDWMLLVTSPAKREGGRRDNMASYVAKDGYVDVREVRAKVGTAQPVDHELIFVDLADSSQRSIDLAALPGIADDPLAAIKAATKAAREAEKAAAEKAAADKAAAEKLAEEKAAAEKAEAEKAAIEKATASEAKPDAPATPEVTGTTAEEKKPQ